MDEDLLGGIVLYVTDLERLSEFYVDVLHLRIQTRDHDHVVLGAKGFQVVLLARSDSEGSPTTTLDLPLPRRAMAAVKPVFVVDSLAAARSVAERAGGVVNAPRHEWRFRGYRVCDGVDPDGNIIQLRERERAT